MQIVIDIDEWKYKSICEGVEASKRCGVATMNPYIDEAIYKGTPLPEGHGDLIDKNKLSKKKQYLFKTDDGAFPKSEWFIKADDLFSAEAIIEADKEKQTKKKARNKDKE